MFTAAGYTGSLGASFTATVDYGDGSSSSGNGGMDYVRGQRLARILDARGVPSDGDRRRARHAAGCARLRTDRGQCRDGRRWRDKLHSRPVRLTRQPRLRRRKRRKSCCFTGWGSRHPRVPSCWGAVSRVSHHLGRPTSSGPTYNGALKLPARCLRCSTG